MSASVEEISEKIEALSSEEQQLLLVKLTSLVEENIDEEVNQEWLNVAKRRLEEIRNDEVEVISGNDVMREAKTRLE